jgi:hypothetical protein
VRDTLPEIPKLTPEQEARLARWPVCKGPCDQGRLPCPTPDHCEVDDDDGPPQMLAYVMMGLAGVLGALVVVHIYWKFIA